MHSAIYAYKRILSTPPISTIGYEKDITLSKPFHAILNERSKEDGFGSHLCLLTCARWGDWTLKNQTANQTKVSFVRWLMIPDPSLITTDVIMTSLLLWKIICVIAYFLILPDFLLFTFLCFEGKNWWIWILPENSTLWRHNDVRLRHCVNHDMPRCWKWWVHYPV